MLNSSPHRLADARRAAHPAWGATGDGGPVTWTLAGYWVGVVLNLAGAGCALTAVTRTLREHGWQQSLPRLARFLVWGKGQWYRLTGRTMEVHVASGSARATATASGTAKGHRAYDATTPLEDQVAWLVDRVRDLQEQAREDRKAAKEAVSKVRSEVTEHASRAEERFQSLEEATREVAVGTAPLQLWGLALVAAGTFLTAITAVPTG